MRWPALTPAVPLLLAAACATPTVEGHLVRRLPAAFPAAWPRPVPVGPSGVTELSQGALSDAEAAQLPRACRAAVAGAVAPGGGWRDAQDDGWRLVPSRLVVDIWRDRSGDRLVRARAVLEVRRGQKLLAASTAVAHLQSGAPSFRSDGVEPREVLRTVEAACRRAALELARPVAPADPAALARARAGVAAVDPGERVAAAHALGQAMSTADTPLLLGLLGDPSADVRRMACWALGELGASDAAAPLGRVAELDADHAVRLEAVVSLNKLLALDPGLKEVMRAARQAAAAGRTRAVPPAPEPEPPPEAVPREVEE